MNISPKDFYHSLNQNGVDFFTGIPDSLLKEFIAYLQETVAQQQHIITSNEGNAIALAAGYHLRSGKIPLVYMQNSGLGNAVNPLLSLCDKEIYSIPMIILIGWRGMPGVKDAIQHVKDGRIQEKFLEVLEIPYAILSGESSYEEVISRAVATTKKDNHPFAILVEPETFDKFDASSKNDLENYISREEALEAILDINHDNHLIISTTGKTSREVHEIQSRNNRDLSKNFLMIGAMGHCSSFALGVTNANPDKRVVCIDGDGSLIMHMGALAIIGVQKPKHFRHIVINNGAHESVGGQPTVGLNIDICSIAKACGYSTTFKAEKVAEIKEALKQMENIDGPTMLEIKVKVGSRKDLGRPSSKPTDDKIAFMDHP